MREKINAAIAYCHQHGTNAKTRNDASNIFANSYEEYIVIWNALLNL